MRETLEQIRELMDAEFECTRRLRVVLNSEQQSIKTRNIKAISNTLAEKLELLERFENLDKQRNSILENAGVQNDRAGFEGFLKKEGEDALITRWNDLESELTVCRELHQVNAQLLDMGQRQVQKVLGILIGEDKSQTEVYDQSGSTNKPLSTHTFAKV